MGAAAQRGPDIAYVVEEKRVRGVSRIRDVARFVAIPQAVQERTSAQRILKGHAVFVSGADDGDAKLLRA